jgi:phospholipase C
MRISRTRGSLFAVATLGVLTAACSIPSVTPGASPTQTPLPGSAQKIKHVIVIMQENRSFDSYFGTYPNADGIPMQNGAPAVCVPDPQTGSCVRPYVDHADVNGGGPHGAANATGDINGGAMDGFVAQALAAKKGCADPANPACTNSKTPDVMGYHVQSDIPNYWSYAQNFVLQDHIYEPNASWSLPAHLFLVSEWSAHCTQTNNPASCQNALQNPGSPPDFGGTSHAAPIYAWTDLTYLLHKNQVSWGYYVVPGSEPDCSDDASLSCAPVKQNSKTPASGTRCRISIRSRTTASWETSRRSTTSTRPPKPALFRQSAGWFRPAR